VIILKLGGSLITDKTKEFYVRKNVLKRVSKEIKQGLEDEIIIVHGGGSFGHPLASKYNLDRGYREIRQIEGVQSTIRAMEKLNSFVLQALINSQIPAVPVHPSSNIICSDGRIESANLEVIRGFLDLKMTPVLYGDVVIDKKKGFCILSGDQIVTYLAAQLKARRVILATDVDGVFDKDPYKFADAKLIEKISKSNLEILEKLQPQRRDVTGGIRGKVLELIKLAEKGTEALIINAKVKGRLKKALRGEEVKGTTVKL
jgi:isopentenyl phosphate kinase